MSTLAGAYPFGSLGEPVEPEPIQHYDHTGQPTVAWLTAVRAIEAEAEDTEREVA